MIPMKKSLHHSPTTCSKFMILFLSVSCCVAIKKTATTLFPYHFARHRPKVGVSTFLYRPSLRTPTNPLTYSSSLLSSSSSSSSMILQELNPSQTEATLRPRYSITRVIAGPGAGKTKVLTSRIAHLLLSHNDDTNNKSIHNNTTGTSLGEGILAVTFTKKAAMEMEKRLGDLISKRIASSTKCNRSTTNGSIGPEDDQVLQQLLQQTTVGTFHSVCSKILRRFGSKLENLPSVREVLRKEDDANGYVPSLDASFNIIDQNDQLRILKDILKDRNIELPSGSGNKIVRPISILNAISLLNIEEAISKTYRGAGKQSNFAEETSKIRKIAQEVQVTFQKAKWSQNSVDFDDLILLTRELLLNYPEVRQTLHRKWRHVLVDEFQDTSTIQLDLVRLLTTNSLFVVGDGDQSIYSWRGASPESMNDFELVFHDKMHGWEGLLLDHEQFNLTQYVVTLMNGGEEFHIDNHWTSPLQVKSVYLMENYRSTTNIVKAAQRVISMSDKTSTFQNDIRKDMKPMRGIGPSPRVFACRDSKAEANYVVKSVNTMIESGELTSTSSVAFIYRTNAQSRLLEEACVGQNLRYIIRGSSGTFYKRTEIQDCLSFLKIMYNSRDRSAWARAVKAPSRGIGEASLEEFFHYCDAVNEEMLKSLDSNKSPLTPMDVILSLASTNDSTSCDIGFFLHPKGFLSTRTLNKLIPFAESLYSLKEKAKVESLPVFLSSIIEDLKLNSHFDAISKTQNEYEDRIGNVMELIQAANRYNDYGPCFGSDLSESPLGSFLDDVALVTEAPDETDSQSGGRIAVNLMTIHSSKGLEFDAVFLVGNEEGTFPTQKSISQGEGSVELSEERRLCYVAMTRAKTHLILTWRKEVAYYKGNSIESKQVQRSRFLDALVGESKSKANVSGIKSKLNNGSVSMSIDNIVSKRALHTQIKPNVNTNPSTRSSSMKRWDDWDPSTHRKPVQQIPSIRPSESVSINSNANILNPTPIRKNSSSQITRRSYQRIERSPMKRQSGIDETIQKQSYHRTVDFRNSLESDLPPRFDSTMFYPIGTLVNHKIHGRGVVQPPPYEDEAFVEKMLVRVKFLAEDLDWDLTMDSLEHTYQ